MIELSNEQVRILQKEAPNPPGVLNPHTREEYVLIRREVFERLRGLLDDSTAVEDAFRAQIESAAVAGWEDPALDIYNDIEVQKP